MALCFTAGSAVQTLEQHVFLYDACVKYGSAGKCQRRFNINFIMKDSSIQTVHNLMNIVTTTELLRKKKHKHRVLTGIWSARSADLNSCDFFFRGLYEGQS
jgi:hypothetical protein